LRRGFGDASAGVTQTLLVPIIGIGNVSDLSTAKGSNTFLAIAPAPLNAKRCALAIVIASFVGFCALVPFTRVPLPRIEAFIPISEAIFGLDLHEAKPGLVTLQHANGDQCQIADAAMSIDRCIDCDRYYTENRSFFLDMEILFHTFLSKTTYL